MSERETVERCVYCLKRRGHASDCALALGTEPSGSSVPEAARAADEAAQMQVWADWYDRNRTSYRALTEALEIAKAEVAAAVAEERATTGRLRDAVLSECDFADDHARYVVGDELLVETGVIRHAVRAALASPGEEPGPPDCPDHKPVQHRDRQPPWCPRCGWTSAQPAVPARQITIVGEES